MHLYIVEVARLFPPEAGARGRRARSRVHFKRYGIVADSHDDAVAKIRAVDKPLEALGCHEKYKVFLHSRSYVEGSDIYNRITCCSCGNTIPEDECASLWRGDDLERAADD
jgi:hypothetical protein